MKAFSRGATEIYDSQPGGYTLEGIIRADRSGSKTGNDFYNSCAQLARIYGQNYEVGF